MDYFYLKSGQEPSVAAEWLNSCFIFMQSWVKVLS